jgi:hypothetical protein
VWIVPVLGISKYIVEEIRYKFRLPDRVGNEEGTFMESPQINHNTSFRFLLSDGYQKVKDRNRAPASAYHPSGASPLQRNVEYL